MAIDVNHTELGTYFNCKKPPLGVMPKQIWQEKRLSELLRAMYEYNLEGRTIHLDWMEEAHQLLSELNLQHQ